MKKIKQVVAFAAFAVVVTVFSSFSAPLSSQCGTYCTANAQTICRLTIVGGPYDGFSYDCQDQKAK